MSDTQNSSEEKFPSSWFEKIEINNQDVMSSLIELISRIFFFTVISALLCLLLLQILPDKLISKSENLSFDLAMQELANQGHAIADRNNKQSFVFIDINNEVHKALQYYDSFPPKNMAVYLKNLANSNAKLAIIDIDFSQQENNELKASMEAYANKDNPPPLLLVRKIAGDLANGTGQLASSIYDDIVEDSNNIHWVSASFLNVKGNPITRHHQLWVAACKDEDFIVLPAVHLLAKELISTGKVASFKKNIQEFNKKNRDLCVDSKTLAPKSLKSLYRDLDTELKLGNDKNKDRVLFLYSLGISKENALWSNDKQLVDMSIRATNLVFSNNNSLFIKQLADKIVILGVSFSSSKDFFDTPLSRMSGSSVIINSVNSILNYGLISSAKWHQNLIASGITILVSVIFVYLSDFIYYLMKKKYSCLIGSSIFNFCSELLVSIVIVSVYLAPWYLAIPLLLKHGIWVNIMLPQAIFSGVYSYQNEISLKSIKITRLSIITKGIKQFKVLKFQKITQSLRNFFTFS